MGKTCKDCGSKNPSNASNCSHCGAVFSMNTSQTITCRFCGKPNPPADNCEFCGAFLLKMTADSSQTKNEERRKRRMAKYSTSPKEILPPSVEIRVMTPVNSVHFPILPPKPPLPVKQPKGRHVKIILKSIVYGGIYVGFFGLVGWLLVMFLSLFF